MIPRWLSEMRWLEFAPPRRSRVTSLAVTVAAIALPVRLAAPAIAAELNAPGSRVVAQAAPDLADEMAYLRRSGRRWIEIDLSGQHIVAWEGNTSVYAVDVSTGTAATPTPTGVYEIYVKYDTARMQGADYDVPDVPYTMYYDGNYAIHGAYWHNSFGTPVSHGCTNVAVNHAAWFYSWASVGTPVVVHY